MKGGDTKWKNMKSSSGMFYYTSMRNCFIFQNLVDFVKKKRIEYTWPISRGENFNAQGNGGLVRKLITFVDFTAL